MAVPATSPSSPACPSCGFTSPAGSRFCNQCGAPLGVPAPSSAAPSSASPPAPVGPGTTPSMAPAGSAPTGAPPVDIRQTVESDRGMLKRLQMLIPGFRGYRQGEDDRAADSLLRLQVADRVHRAVAAVQDCRATLTQMSQFQALTDLGPVLAELMQLEGEIRHAEQGYTGISPAVRMNPAQLDNLYQYDYGFVAAADQVNQALAPLASAATTGNSPAIAAAIQSVRGQVRQLDSAFKARIRAIEGIQV